MRYAAVCYDSFNDRFTKYLLRPILKLAIPPWVGAMSMAIVSATAREETVSSA